MSIIKKLDAAPMTAAEITKPIPMTRLEHFIVIDHLWTGPPAGTMENAKNNKDLYQALAQGWDWETFTKGGGLAASLFEEPVKPAIVLTKRQARHLREIVKPLSGQLEGKRAYSVLDLIDRLDFILTTD